MENRSGNAEFEQISWHDNALYGVRIESCDADANDWRSDLVLAIDHIVEWVSQPGERIRFRVAPATLTFHDVTNLAISIDWGAVTLHDMAIDHIDRQAVPHPSGNAGLPWYRWRIALNWPAAGDVVFNASGFTQELLAEPALLDEQSFPPAARRANGFSSRA